MADDKTSLTADVIMRVEDTRALATPSLAWTLPAVFLYGDNLGWWNAATKLNLGLAAGAALPLLAAAGYAPGQRDAQAL